MQFCSFFWNNLHCHFVNINLFMSHCILTFPTKDTRAWQYLSCITLIEHCYFLSMKKSPCSPQTLAYQFEKHLFCHSLKATDQVFQWLSAAQVPVASGLTPPPSDLQFTCQQSILNIYHHHSGLCCFSGHCHWGWRKLAISRHIPGSRSGTMHHLQSIG